MTEISLDDQPFGFVPRDNERADVCGPGAADAFQPVMRRKFIGQTTAKVVRLTDIYRIPPQIGGLTAKDIDAADGVEHRADCVVLKFVSSAFNTGPN